jgi:hypothetical protein
MAAGYPSNRCGAIVVIFGCAEAGDCVFLSDLHEQSVIISSDVADQMCLFIPALLHYGCLARTPVTKGNEGSGNQYRNYAKRGEPGDLRLSPSRPSANPEPIIWISSEHLREATPLTLDILAVVESQDLKSRGGSTPAYPGADTSSTKRESKLRLSERLAVGARE